jgi:hypothetical protein
VLISGNVRVKDPRVSRPPITPDDLLAYLSDPMVYMLLALIITEKQEIETGNHTDRDVQFCACQAIVSFADHVGCPMRGISDKRREEKKRAMRSAE